MLFAIFQKQITFYVNVLKRPVLNSIGRFVFQRFKNIFEVDVCCVFIDYEMVILPP